jgi:ABC-type uncharacterized transport system substrate-binding protein
MRAAALALVAALAAPAVPAADVAILKSGDTPAWRPALEALHRVAAGHALAEIDLGNDPSQAARAAAGLRGRFAAVVAFGPLAVSAVRQAAPDLPLVVCMVQDLGGLGLEPGPGIAGVVYQVPVRNQLAAFRLVLPRARRLGVIHGAESVGALVAEAQRAAGFFQIEIVERRVAAEREVPAALRALIAGAAAVDALWLPPEPMLLGEEARRFLLSETLRAGKAVLTFSPALVREGALASSGPDMAFTGLQAGELLNRLLGPDKAARIEFLIPKAELVVNRSVAERLRIDIPAEALKAAAKIF